MDVMCRALSLQIFTDASLLWFHELNRDGAFIGIEGEGRVYRGTRCSETWALRGQRVALTLVCHMCVLGRVRTI